MLPDPLISIFAIVVFILLSIWFAVAELKRPSKPVAPPAAITPTPTIINFGIVIGPKTYFKINSDGDKEYVSTIRVRKEDVNAFPYNRVVDFVWDDTYEQDVMTVGEFSDTFTLNTEVSSSLT